ncbi:hypothetical protein LUZ60_002703 [Juncus effusus]|nr:hypothetical protein LUZ60_002703 [Juncus effusus]
MSPDTEIEFEVPSLIRIYKGGHVERLQKSDAPPASLDLTAGVESKDVEIISSTGLLVRIYLPNLVSSPDKKVPIIVYCHGGCFVIGFDSRNHAFMNRLASQANVIAVSVDYRLAPENPIPAPYNDSLEALKWVVSHANGGPEPWLVSHGDFNNVFVVGFSAGGNIVHNVALQDVRFTGLVVIHPYFLASERLASEPTDPELRDNLEKIWPYIYPGTSGLDDPVVNPVGKGAPSLKGLNCERVMVCLAEDELTVRGKVYYEGLQKSGWGDNAELLESDGEGHDFFTDNPDGEKAVRMMSRLVAFINRGN